MSSILPYHALKIAHEDAIVVYGNLDAYTICIHFDNDNWRVDYELTDPDLTGGGPHYLISAENGEILEKRYEQ